MQRSVTLHFRLAKDEDDHLNELARQAKRGRADVIRALLAQGVVERVGVVKLASVKAATTQ